MRVGLTVGFRPEEKSGAEYGGDALDDTVRWRGNTVLSVADRVVIVPRAHGVDSPPGVLSAGITDRSTGRSQTTKNGL